MYHYSIMALRYTSLIPASYSGCPASLCIVFCLLLRRKAFPCYKSESLTSRSPAAPEKLLAKSPTTPRSLRGNFPLTWHLSNCPDGDKLLASLHVAISSSLRAILKTLKNFKFCKYDPGLQQHLLPAPTVTTPPHPDPPSPPPPPSRFFFFFLPPSNLLSVHNLCCLLRC